MEHFVEYVQRNFLLNVEQLLNSRLRRSACVGLSLDPEGRIMACRSKVLPAYFQAGVSEDIVGFLKP